MVRGFFYEQMLAIWSTSRRAKVITRPPVVFAGLKGVNIKLRRDFC
jgi:hypothetical protein